MSMKTSQGHKLSFHVFTKSDHAFHDHIRDSTNKPKNVFIIKKLS